MTTSAHPIQRPFISRSLRGILCALVLMTTGVATARAQSDYASIPPALAPGSPAGSYRLSDIDTVNLFNGSVNVNLPLTGISGRGAVKDVAAVSWTSPARWQIVKGYDAYGGAVYGPQIDPMSDSTGRLHLGSWGAYFRKSVDVVLPCGPNYEGIFYAQYTLVRLHVVEPDGTDHELRDTVTGGLPFNNPGCTYQGQSRGREFVSSDGSGITVLFDDVIRDGVQIDQPDVTGGGAGVWLLLPDGRKLRSTADSLTMRDRNGNMMTWEDHTGGSAAGDVAVLPGDFSAVKDSLGRRVTPGSAPVSECVARGGDSQGVCSYISYKGFGGVERRIYIGTNSAYLTTGVFLPGGLSYRFYYNQYDDLRRIDLPTGGSIEYEYGPGLDGPQPTPDYRITNPLPGTYDGGPSDFHVYRRVTERRLYKEGHVLVNKQTFSKPEHTQNGNAGFVEKKVYDSNGTTLLGSEKHYFYGGANDTFNVWLPFAYAPWKIGREYHSEFYDAGGNLLSQNSQEWQQRAPVSWWTGNPDEAPSNDPRIYQTTTALENGLVSMTTYGYDPNVPYNSQTDVQEYDYGVGGPGPLLRHTHTDYITDPAYTGALTGAYLRNLPLQQWVSTDIWGGNRLSQTNYGYDEFSLQNRANITGHDAAYTTGKTVRGNLTSVTRYANALGLTGPVSTTTHYDIAGNVVSVTDAKGNTTQLSYEDSFCNDNGVRCDGTFTPYTYAFPSLSTSPVPDVSTALTPAYPAGTFGSTSALTSTTVYDFYTGLTYSKTDANNQTTRMEYDDPLERPTAQIRPGTTGGRTDISYASDGRSAHTLSDLDGSRRTESYQYFDGLGRIVRTQQLENSDPAKPWITVDTEYDAQSRVKRVSSPYRWTAGTSSPFSTNAWKEMTYDALGRPRAVTTQPYGATLITDFSGDRVLVKDPAGKERVTRSDALGRVTEVWEVTPQESGGEASTVNITSFPEHPEASHGYLTSYKYDALGNLRMVEQAGQHLGQAVVQRRFFAYDSLGRLLRVKHPEQGDMTPDAAFPALTDATSGVSNSQWSVGYVYDSNGNVVKRKDARTATLGVTTTYHYDNLNRNVITSYTTPAGSGAATTPDVRRFYDGAANGLGRMRRAEAVGVSASEIGSYDAMGRPTQYRQSFWVNGSWGQDFAVERAYNKAGGLTWQKYPSQRAVTYNYDAAGRLGDYDGQPAFGGTLGDGTQRAYASEVRYHELGGMEQERFGTQTPVYNKSLFNSRGQLAEIRVSTYAITSAGHETDWNRGAIVNHYSSAANAWGATGGGSDNNGNLLKQEVHFPADGQLGEAHIVQEYGYDALNRLTAVYDKPSNGAADFYQFYKYDRWGNRTVDPNSWNAPAQQFSVDAATNRLGVPAGQTGAMNYDAAGNLVNDSYSAYGDPAGQQTRFYDAEGRMTSAGVSASQTAAYAYDADGRRVKRNTSFGEAWQVYGPGGELLAEYAPKASPTQPLKEYGYRGGELLVTFDAPARRNVALASNGATATAQNYTADGVFQSLHFQPSYANDGKRYATSQGDHYWRDEHALPSFLQIDFSGEKAIDEVDVYTLADHPAYMTQADPSATQSFTQYGVTSFVVQYWTGTTWEAVQGGSVSGNSLVWRKLTFPSVTTSKIRVVVNAAVDGVARVTEVEAWGTDQGRSNVALQSQGGAAVASSTTPGTEFPGLTFPVNSVNNGDRKGLNWEHGGGWRDGTNNSYPDWVQVGFGGEKTIDEIDVFTVQDAINSPSEPTEAMTFTQYGVTGYEVQYWTGSAWATVPGGSVTGNNKVWRKFTFPALTTSKVRVVVNNALASRSRLVEVEAWGTVAANPTANVRWLVSDQLGTPRMVIDQTGSLSGVTRHDYLPFGEGVPGEASWRTGERGYGGDAVRQKFTGYERDAETGLDYAQARYFASGLGRFTGVDPLLASASAGAPQTWNRYTYALNNPLRLTDPSGMDPDEPDQGQVQNVPQQQTQRPTPQQPPSPNPQPAPSQDQRPTNVRIDGPQPSAGLNVPTANGQFLQGYGTDLRLTPTDQNGNSIPNVTVREEVNSTLTLNGVVAPTTTLQNPAPVTSPTGVVPDQVAHGIITPARVNEGSQATREGMRSILATPTTLTQVQWLFITTPTGRVGFTVYQRTLTNVGADGTVRPYTKLSEGNFTLDRPNSVPVAPMRILCPRF